MMKRRIKILKSAVLYLKGAHMRIYNFYRAEATHFWGSKDPFGNHLMVGYPVTSYLVHRFFWSSQSTYPNTRKRENCILSFS